ncbi:glycoside hydrolase family 55 protein [Dactylosporangium sp. CA-139114]|uniref:glycoside hydrolase family 55 protein n=1 Tax=Dactylosporangium sp. CA-139114 TaxID=3239931 RepID=UPI003D970785
MRPRLPGAGFPPGAVESPARRALLTRGSVLAVGAGVGIAGAATAVHHLTSGGGTPARAIFDVREMGATGDGKTDDTEKLQKAIDAAQPTGGVVYLPPGVYLTGRLTLHSRVHLRGAGDATVIRLRPGAGTAILESAGFERLTGSGDADGISNFSVRDLVLDGNKAQNQSGGFGLRIYGYGYELTEVTILNCRQDGMYSEWVATPALPYPSHQMESRLTAVRSHDNDGHGINFNGPHDSMFVNCVSFENGGSGFRLAGWSNGSSMVNCHGWGMRQRVAFELDAPAIGCVNCYADINGGIGVRISRSDCRWFGGLVLGGSHSGSRPEIGVQFALGPDPGEPAGSLIDTKILNCATAAVDFGFDRGRSSVRANVCMPEVSSEQLSTTPTRAGWIGKPHPTSLVEIVQGLADVATNLVAYPAFELRAQPTPPPPGDQSVRVFARQTNGKVQLCAQFPNGAVQVISAQP